MAVFFCYSQNSKLRTSALPILAVIATIIDAPATVLNVVGDASASLLVGRIVDGKNFLKSRK